VSARSKEYHRKYCGTIYQEEVFFLRENQEEVCGLEKR
jgi:hypothetical protein